MDDNVFDFMDDSTPEVTRPRINEASLTISMNQDDDSQIALDGNDFGVETNSEQVALNQEAEEETEEQAAPSVGGEHGEPDKEENHQFHSCVEHAHRDNSPSLCGEIKTGIELMGVLNKTGGRSKCVNT